MAVNSRLFKLLRGSGLGHQAAVLLAKAPDTVRATHTAADGDIVLANATVRSVADAVTVSGSKTVTSATAAFVAGDVGHPISGAGIPAGTTIAARASGTSITLSANATASATGVTIVVGYPAFTVNLPPVEAGAQVTVVAIGSEDITVATPGAEKINGANTVVLGTQYDAARLVCDGANWFEV